MDRVRADFPRAQALFPRLGADGLLRFVGPDSSAAAARPGPVATSDGAGSFLTGVAILVGYQWLGECLVSLLRLPVSGPVAGMVLLFATLVVRGRSVEPLERSADGLLTHLPLYFVPAGVGVIQYADRIRAEWLPIAVALIAGTLVTLAATAWTMKRAQRALAAGSTKR